MKKNNKSLFSTLSFVLTLLAVFFLAELTVEYLFEAPLPKSNEFLYYLSHILLMTVVGAPVLWWFVVKSRRGEEGIRKEREFTANLLKGLREGFAAIDHEGKLILVNDELCKMTGYSEKELLNQRPPFNFWAEEGADDIKETFEKTLKGMEGDYELIFKRKDDERFLALVSPRITTDPDGNVISLATIKDITERKRLEEILNKERHDLKLIIDSSPIIIFYKDIEGKFIRVNRTFADALNMPEEDFVGKTVFDLYSERIAQGMTNDDNEVLTSGCPKLNIIEQYESASGIRWVQTDKIPICDNNGIPVGLIGFALDITERKRSEEALKEREQRLTTLYENVNEIIFYVDVEAEDKYRFQSVNPAFLKATGLKASQVVGKMVSEVLPESSLSLVLSKYRKAIQNKESVRWEEVTAYPSGIKVGDVTVTPIFDEQGICTNLIGTVYDITERKRTEEALKESEEKYRAMMNDAGDAIALADIKGNLLDANKKMEELTGYTKNELLNMTFVQFHPQDELERIVAAFQETAQNGTPKYINDTLILRKDRKTVHVDLTGSVVQYAGKRMQQAVFRDLTERKQAELEYKTVLYTSMDGFYLVDTEGRILDVNDSYCNLTGYSRDELLNMNLRDIEAEETPEKIGERIRRIIEVGWARFETRHRRRDGRIIEIEASVNYLEAGGGKFFVFMRDITERKRSEKELQESEEKFRSITERSFDIISMLDSEGRFTYVSPSVESLLGFSPEEIIGRPFQDYIPESDIHMTEQAFNNAINGNLETIVRTGFLRKDGGYISIEGNGTPIIKDGKVIGVQAIIRDVTSRKRAEEALSRELNVSASIAELSTALISQTTIEEISSLVLERAKRLTGSRFGYTGYIDLQTGYLVSPALTRDIWDVCNVKDKNIVFEKFTGLFGWVLNNRKPLLTNAPDKDPRSSGTPEGHIPIQRFLSVPAMIGETLVGQISVANSDHDYTERDLMLLERLGTIYAIVLQRKKIEEALQQSEEKYRTLIENIQDGVFIMQDAKVQFANEAFARIGGYKVEEVIGMDLRELAAPEDLEMVANYYHRRQAGENVPEEYEFRLLRKDKSRAIANLNVGLITYQGRVASMGTVKDITERKRIEEELKDSEERYRMLVEHTPDAIIVHSKGRVIFSNMAGASLMGVENPEQLNGILIKDFVHPDYWETVKERIRRMRDEGMEVPCIEQKFIRMDGKVIDVEVTAIPLTYMGEFAIQGVIRDITERKRAEEQIKASLKEKEILLREIHHRVKNNIQVISSLLSLQAGYITEEKYLDMFRESQNRILSMSLIHEKLYHSRDLTKIDFNDYVRDLVYDLFEYYGANTGSIALNINVENVSLGIDSAIPCGLIINELVTNSLKYAFPDGRKGELNVSLRPIDDNMIELIIGDNGIGIPEELDFRNTRSLGLHLVTILVENQLHGEINLDRSKGTEFQIKFKGGK